MVTIAAPADAEHVVSSFRVHVPAIESDGEAEVELAMETERIELPLVIGGKDVTTGETHRREIRDHKCPTCLSPCQMNVAAIKQVMPYARFLVRASMEKRRPSPVVQAPADEDVPTAEDAATYSTLWYDGYLWTNDHIRGLDAFRIKSY